ncbi:hypothetical protein FIE12Z_12299, partial [Fusarium flagelliforme]
PKPLPSALRITKNIHNVLQGVSPPSQRITAEEKEAVIHWITENAYRYWFSESGPLRPMEEGGAHVIIVSIFLVSRSGVQLLPPSTLSNQFVGRAHIDLCTTDR